MKKLIIIIIFILISSVGYFGYKYVYSKKNLEATFENKKDVEFKNEEERREYIKSFESTEHNQEDNIPFDESQDEETENYGGFKGIQIENIQKLTSFLDLDRYILFQDKITTQINLLSTIFQDIDKLKKEELETYYKKNSTYFLSVYGLNKFEEFEKFISSMSIFKNGVKINSVKIDSEVKEQGNVLTFNLLMKTSNGKSITKNINVIKSIKNKDVLIVWEWE